MMNLLGCKKENFIQLMGLMNYKKDKSNQENTFVYKGERKIKKIQKFIKKNNSPFRKLESMSFK